MPLAYARVHFTFHGSDGRTLGTAEAQSDRAAWLAWRTGKEARYARVTPNPQRDVLVLTGIRAFPDPAGHIVIVGEARNASEHPLAYTRVHFTFRGNDGRPLGTEWSYVFGGTLGRIIESGLNESVLLPGTSGFFKVWTSIPFAAVASHPMLSAGDQLPFAKPLASLGAEDINRDDRPDLIWQHRTTGDLAAWLMDGTRQLRAVSLGQVADTNWVLVGPK